ncbi:MAG: NAD(P)H-dependent oxidoreductase subunit E [Candidatus Zixiibacteriota bacterium]|nr:MAG: NAD(P)H-dependent oxidoreductase subunit E [candidate division Zixibacteria bacterium]
MVNQVVDLDRVKEVIDRSPKKPGSLIGVLQDIQREFHYLPKMAMTETARELNVPLSKVWSVATFYNAFSLTPRGENIIRVCKGTACHIKGADLILEQIETGLGLKPGDTSEDMKYTVEVVNCVGACAMAPVMIVNSKYHGNVRCDRVLKLVKKV